tara:strand:+ start:41 stop:343 length:303 start_codon:yes stop_codon:yes gene_type:complete
MKILTTKEEIVQALANEELHPPEASLSMMMKNKTYNCGCGKFHPVDTAKIGAACRGRSVAHSGVGKGFILVCDTHQTLVVTEGFFNYSFKSIWSAANILI